MGDLETLETVAALGLLTSDIKHGIDKFGALSVMTFGPVVTCTSLPKNKVIRSKELAKWSGSNRIHGTWLEVHQNCSRDISTSRSLIVVDIDPLKLKIGVSVISTGWVNTMLVGNNFPELGTDLVAALTSLDMDDFSHSVEFR